MRLYYSSFIPNPPLDYYPPFPVPFFPGSPPSSKYLILSSFSYKANCSILLADSSAISCLLISNRSPISST